LTDTWRRRGLAALSGLLLILSFPKFGHWSVAWIALAPLLLALPGTSGAESFRLGYLTGAVSSVGILYWTALVVIQYGGLSLPVGIAVMGALCLAVALFPSLFAWLVGRWHRAAGDGALLLAPVAWVATEILRAHTLLNFSWCLLGYSQHANLPFIQIASYAAVYGVSFLVAASSATLAYATVVPRPGARRTALGGLGLLLGVVFVQGCWALRRPVEGAGTVRVGLVQGDIRQGQKWDPARAWLNLDRHLDLSRRAAAQGARLVVWPESAVPFYFDRTPAFAEEVRELVRRHRLYLAFGNDDREDSGSGEYRIWVGAKLVDPEGGVVMRYHKIRLVPFGEYVPVQTMFTLGGRLTAKLVEEVADFTPGTEHALGEVDGHRLGAFICYEAIFPDLVRGFAARGAELLVNVTNDAWYGTTSAPYQHLAMAVFRAVENGKYLVRAANTGITAVVDPKGRVVDRTGLFEPAVLVRDVAWVPGGTFYTRHGDVFAWGCLGAALAFTAATWRRRG
jgi:apolipoprotein N-acyltransferase